MKKLLFLALLLSACKPELDTERLDTAIEEQLRAGPMLSTAFLTLKYGDSRPVVARKLEALRDAGTVASIAADREGEHPLASEASGFKLSTPSELQGIKWDINTSYHNDSLSQVRLSAFIDDHDPQLEYQALRNKYFEVYGGPAAAIPTQAVFVQGSQRVDVTHNEQMLGITYQNTALEKRIYNMLTKCVFDKMGNSYNPVYYKQVVVPTKPTNPDHI
jgi:hypothetical protein